ncbi:MAG: hypothetical protein ABEI07_02410 [Candidatus Nanohaloarchaea archaeon]
MVEWPEPLTISNAVRELKKRFTESFSESAGEGEKERDLNYIVAVSSGKAVSEEIPQQIGKRAGWASQQGANFVELLIENPAQLVMDEDTLLNLSRQLDLHYNIHSSTSMAYGMSYRRGRGNGFDPAHEYTVKLLKAVKKFGGNLRRNGEAEDQNGHPRLYAINGHMAVAQFPPEEERLAQDVSVDPYGLPMEKSRIFEVKEARLGIWRHFVWDYLGVKDDIQDFARVINSFEDTRDVQDFVRSKIVDLLEEDGYISNEQLRAINTLADERVLDLQEMPRKVSDLKTHLNGRQLAQRAASLDLSEVPGVEEVVGSVPHTKTLDLSQRNEGWDHYESRAQDLVLREDSEAFQEVEDLLAARNGFTEDEAEKAMRDLVNIRMLHDDFNKESSIFRRIIPLWMPFAEEPVRQVWENITGKSFGDHTEVIDWLYGSENVMDRPRREEDVIAASTGAYVWGHFTQVPPGYEQEGPLVKMLDDAEVYWSFESHMAGPAENARIWKPKDMIEVVKAINETPVEYEDENGNKVEEAFERTRITIDMEHIASQKVDPMWVVDPPEEVEEEEGYKGLEEGDGRYVMINHVTHPYITEEGHQHGPIRRGDTLVYRYIYTLVEKGMCTDEDLPTVVMYEIGTEKDETLYNLRLILNMIEHGIGPDELEGENATEIINKDEPENLKEYLIQKFFGVTDTEVQHEWQEIHEHALDPLEDLLEAPSGTHTWMGRAATERGARPEEWQEEEYE